MGKWVKVFRSGDRLASDGCGPHWTRKLEVVHEYAYLGYQFSNKLSINVPQLLCHFKKSYHSADYGNVFIAKVSLRYLTPTNYTYRSRTSRHEQLWGYWKNPFAAVGKFSKCNVFSWTSNVICGDTCHYPMSILALIRSVHHWLGPSTMENKRDPKKVYQMMSGTECTIGGLGK